LPLARFSTLAECRAGGALLRLGDLSMTAVVSVVGSARATVGGCGGATVVPGPGLPGQFRAPLQLHRSLDRLDALASRSNGLTERSPEPLVGFDQLRVLIRRGNRRL
jgi:hypothetical protein